MKKSKRDFLEVNRQIRKPMPSSTRVILNIKDKKKEERFDWRKQLEEEQAALDIENALPADEKDVNDENDSQNMEE